MAATFVPWPLSSSDPSSGAISLLATTRQDAGEPARARAEVGVGGQPGVQHGGCSSTGEALGLSLGLGDQGQTVIQEPLVGLVEVPGIRSVEVNQSRQRRGIGDFHHRQGHLLVGLNGLRARRERRGDALDRRANGHLAVIHQPNPGGLLHAPHRRDGVSPDSHEQAHRTISRQDVAGGRPDLRVERSPLWGCGSRVVGFFRRVGRVAGRAESSNQGEGRQYAHALGHHGLRSRIPPEKRNPVQRS